MRTSEQIKAEIQERFGFVPPFFEPAQAVPEVLENLWQQTLSAYINNPLPALFKEKLFAYLSRFCTVPYCIICHSCVLRPLGLTPQEILALLQEPPPNLDSGLEVQWTALLPQQVPLTAWPAPNSTLERCLFRYAIAVYLSPYDAQQYRSELRRLLGSVYDTHLMALIAYIKMCHQWVECYPELVYEADQRAQLYLGTLLQEEPALADFFQHYNERVRQERRNGTEHLLAELVSLQRVEAALQKSNNLLQAVVEGTTDSIFVKDRQGCYVMLNATAAECIGKSVAEIIGKNDIELLSLEDGRQLMETDRTIMTTGQSQVVEENVTLNGIAKTYLSTKNVYRDRQGNIIGLIGISRDITERKQMERDREQLLEQLRRETEDLAALNAVTANAISTLNLDELLDVLLYRIVSVIGADTGVILLKENDRLQVRTSIGLEAEVISGFAVSMGQGFAGAIAATEKPLYIENAQIDSRISSPILRQCGICTMLGVPMKHNGNLIGVLHVDWFSIHPYSDRELHLLEITAERAAMAILNAQLYAATKQLQERLQLQIDTMPIGCMVTDREFHCTDWNPAAESIFGFTKAEVLGKSPNSLIVPATAQARVDEMLRRLADGDRTADLITENITKDGKPIICEWHNTPLQQADSTIIGFLLMVQDITERQQAEAQLEQSEERLRNVLENMPVMLDAFNADGQIIVWNHECETVTGYSAAEMIGNSQALALLYPDADYRDRMMAQWRDRGNNYRNWEWQLTCKNGTVKTIAWSNLSEQFPIPGWEAWGIGVDVTSRVQAEIELRHSLKNLSDMKFALDKAAIVAVTNASGTITYANDKFCEISQYSKQELIGKSHGIVNSGFHSKEFFQKLWSTITSGKVWQGEIKNKAKDGTYYWVDSTIVPFLNDQGIPYQYLAIRFDITARKLAEAQLRHYAFYDPLTGLPNRTLFLQQLEQLIDTQQRGEERGVTREELQTNIPRWKDSSPLSQFAVLSLDLNRFQVVKYSLGHRLADQLIVMAARRLEACLSNFGEPILDARGENFSESSQTAELEAQLSHLNFKIANLKFMVARIGVDEFAILLDNIREVGNATNIANRLCQELQLPFKLNEREVFVTPSIGIAPSSGNEDRAEDFLRAANTAMHQAKLLRQARYEVFKPDMHADAVERLQLEAELRRAIERQELRVYYQPIVSLKNSKIIGFEALVRWQHPQRGFISPGDFIPLAEETGLIALIDRWVLHEACHQMSLWQRAFPSKPPLTLSVNLSGLELAQLGLIERIDQILGETGIQRQSVKLEITESSLTENTAIEIAMLEQLKALEIELLIDDFGTGYSSLARLHQMPIDTLKIDRSFIAQMSVDRESLEIVRAIIALAHTLKLDAIAEGVETAEQLSILQALECEHGQGYFFSRPVDSEAVWALLNKNWVLGNG